MSDIASKNQIVKEGIGNIDKIVNDKYGGDWSKASKEIARSVTQMRANPFWNAQKEVEKKRGAFQEQVTKFGPKGMIFGADPRNLSTLDEQGQVRGADQFSGEVVEQGDWGKTAREIFSTLTPDKLQSAGLTRLEQGYLVAGELTRISPVKLDALAGDEDIQRAFQQSHPEFVRGFQELGDREKQQFGLEGESLQEVTKRTLFGNIAPAAFEQRERQFLVDRQAEIALKAQQEARNTTYFGSGNYQPIVSTEAGNKLEEHKKTIAPPSTAGTVGTPVAGGPAGLSPVFYDNMTEQQKEAERQRALGAREKYLDDYYGTLQAEYDELKDIPREEGFKIYEDHLQKAAEQTTTSWNLRLEDSSKNVKTQLFSNMNSGNFSAITVKSTGDVFDINNIAEKLQYKNHADFQEAIDTGVVEASPKIDFSNAALSIDISSNPAKKSVRPVTVNFSPDVQTQEILDRGQTVTEMFVNHMDYEEGAVEPVQLTNYRGDPTGQAVVVVGTGSIIDPNKKEIWLLDYNNQTRRPISLQQYQEMEAGEIDTRFNNYEGLAGNPGKIK